MAPAYMWRIIACVCFFVCTQAANNEWVTFALKTQRNLISSFTIDKAPLVGTHNSYSSAYYNSLFQNQELSLTSQLDLGVRYIELDLHYVVELNQTEQGPFRICHTTSNIYNPICSAQGWDNCTRNGILIINYGEDTGCSPMAPNYTTIFQEISAWMQANPDSVVVINFDDSISDADVSAENNMTELVNSWLGKYFGNSTYTPLDLTRNDNKWPTIQEMTKQSKNLVINTNKHTFGGVYIHTDLRGFLWPESKIKFFSGYPNCTSTTHTGSLPVQFAFFQEDRLVLTNNGSLLYNGSAEVGLFTNETVLSVMRCEYTTFYDYFSANSAETLVWSWDYAQPATGMGCASINTKTGRWIAEDCEKTSHFFACRSNSNSSSWTISSSSATRNTKTDTSSCPTGFSFATPRTAKQNFELLASIPTSNTNNNNNIWISMNLNANNTWSEIPPSASNTPTPNPTPKPTAKPSTTMTTTTTGSSSSTPNGSAVGAIIVSVLIALGFVGCVVKDFKSRYDTDRDTLKGSLGF